jgi:hypothetical protein
METQLEKVAQEFYLELRREGVTPAQAIKRIKRIVEVRPDFIFKEPVK